ncbi:MAG: PP2C family protein-serine/threonine phosphatase [Jiangellaceae bacterium]
MTWRSEGVLRRRPASYGWWARIGRWLAHEPVALAVLALSIAVIYVLHVTRPGAVPLDLFVIPVLLGGFALPVPSLLVLVVMTGGVMVAEAATRGVNERYLAVLLVITVTTVVALGSARSRARLGVQGNVGESMLVDLKERLLAQGEVPALPRGWEVEVVHRSAGRSTFSGDFLVAARSANGMVLEVALIDVSGKGLGAGTRALLLSGAFGGLLGSLPPEEFLPAANAYLLRQEWAEGFATAVYLVVDLGTGEYQVRSAGHPPAIQFHAGSGRWQTLGASGGLLGVFEKDEYVPAAGQLQPGDALLLYTDGLVETPRRDLTDGIDKLQGEAERLVAKGFRHGARKLIDAVAASDSDDRALILLWRT